MGREQYLIDAQELLATPDVVVVDCRFSLAEHGAGSDAFGAGHIPGAHYLDLNLDLSSRVMTHGGRHPLPNPQLFIQTLAHCGIGPDTAVVAYDDSRFAFAARLWWLMRSLGYRPPRLLNGGYSAWLAAGGAVEICGRMELEPPLAVSPDGSFSGYCDINEMRELQASGAVLVDSREPRRYQGLEEPIDPVAGHIPGAINHPWQGVTDEAGMMLDATRLQEHWGDTLQADKLVVYCGSGVTACVNLFSLAVLGRDDAMLYAGSWSDWCSYL